MPGRGTAALTCAAQQLRLPWRRKAISGQHIHSVLPCAGPPDGKGIEGLLAALVAVATENPPGREGPLARLLAEELQASGAAVEIAPLSGEGAAERCNVAARLRNGKGPLLAFNSHLDVVPAGEGWTRPPFTLTREGGRLYGRGAADAKGSIAAMVEAFRLLAKARDAWQGTLLAVFVADEEVHSRGAKDFVAAAPEPIDCIVIGEPTQNRVVSAHKGSVRLEVLVRGRAAHSGTPQLGSNAIEGAAALVQHCVRFNRELSRRPHALVGAPSLTVTRILGGGPAENVVPDSCRLVLDRRTVPGETRPAVLLELEQLLHSASCECGMPIEIAAQRATSDSAETPANDDFVALACRVAAAHGVERPGPFGFGGGCDLVHFRQLGARGVILGPGGLDVAHQPDEFVSVSELHTAASIYRDIALGFLQREGWPAHQKQEAS